MRSHKSNAGTRIIVTTILCGVLASITVFPKLVSYIASQDQARTEAATTVKEFGLHPSEADCVALATRFYQMSDSLATHPAKTLRAEAEFAQGMSVVVEHIDTCMRDTTLDLKRYLLYNPKSTEYSTIRALTFAMLYR